MESPPSSPKAVTTERTLRRDDSRLDDPKDRERPRLAQNRPSLAAVGRVASRVTSSSISRISNLLPKPREGDEEIDASPWGVGTAAVPRSMSTSILVDSAALSRLESRTSPRQKRASEAALGERQEEILSPNQLGLARGVTMASPTGAATPSSRLTPSRRHFSDAGARRGAADAALRSLGRATIDEDRSKTNGQREDPVAVSSPMSNDDDRRRTPTSPTRPETPDGERRAPKVEPRQKPNLLGLALEKQPSAVKSKFHFRPSLLVDAASTAEGGVEQETSVPNGDGEKGRTEDKSVEGDGEVKEEVEKEKTEKEKTEKGTIEKGTEQKEKEDMSSSKVTFASEVSEDPVRDVERSRIFNLTGFGRAKSGRAEGWKKKGKSKSGGQERKLVGLGRAKSGRLEGEGEKKRGWFSSLWGEERLGRQHSGKEGAGMSRGAGSVKRKEEKVEKGEQRREQKSEGEINVVEAEEFLEESISATVRSLAKDDFISYQTKNKKKGKVR